MTKVLTPGSSYPTVFYGLLTSLCVTFVYKSEVPLRIENCALAKKGASLSLLSHPPGCDKIALQQLACSITVIDEHPVNFRD